MDKQLLFDDIQEKRFAPAANAAAIEVKVDQELQDNLNSIPDKLAFKIGEVADLVDVKPYVLRYWQGEFDALKPKKSKHNQRVYLKKDVELVMMIKKLLYRDRYSIEGARSALKNLKKDKKKVQVIKGVSEHMEMIRDQAEDLLESVSQLRTLFS